MADPPRDRVAADGRDHPPPVEAREGHHPHDSARPHRAPGSGLRRLRRGRRERDEAMAAERPAVPRRAGRPVRDGRGRALPEPIGRRVAAGLAAGRRTRPRIQQDRARAQPARPRVPGDAAPGAVRQGRRPRARVRAPRGRHAASLRRHARSPRARHAGTSPPRAIARSPIASSRIASRSRTAASTSSPGCRSTGSSGPSRSIASRSCR